MTGVVTRKRASTSHRNAPDKQEADTDSSKNNKRGRRPRSVAKRTEPTIQEEEEEDEIYIETGKRLFYGYEEERAYLEQLLKTLLRQNKANSVIVCGDTGFGKNYLVESCLAEYPVVRKEPDSEFGHLNVELFQFDGNLHGKNDLATLRLIGRRLNCLLEKSRQVTMEDDEEPEDDEFDETDMSSKVANSIPKIIAQFRFLIEHSPNFRCIIILDHLEVFSYRQQYLLYNLFDLIQQGRSVLIIGLTRRLDCVQLLTSRVQSRLNRRMIHLVAPFKSLEAYSKFCKNYCKRLGFDHTQIDKEQFQKEIEKSFSLNRSFDGVKQLVHQHLFVPKHLDGKQSDHQQPPTKSNNGPVANLPIVLQHKDPKIIELSCLTRNEMVLLVVATKQCRHLEIETFTCKQLYEWSVRVSQLKLLQFDHVVKCIYRLLELDLLIVAKETRSQSSKTVQLWIAPWTSLMLNISEFQIKQLFDSMANKLPAFIKQLLE